MPDALDLLTICVEAGLGFDAAMAKVSEKWESNFLWPLPASSRRSSSGKIRREALRDMADRIGLAEMTSFVAAVIQSEQLGVSMAKVLRIQSDQMRVKRRQTGRRGSAQSPDQDAHPNGRAHLPFPVYLTHGPRGSASYEFGDGRDVLIRQPGATHDPGRTQGFPGRAHSAACL